MTQTVTPYLLYEDAEAAAAFVTRAFGFKEVDRMTGAAGGVHLEFETEFAGRIYAGQPPEGFRNPADVGRTSLVYVLVSAVDSHYDHARAEGATITEELVDLPFRPPSLHLPRPPGARVGLRTGPRRLRRSW